jgi:MFS family permease
MTGSTCAAVSRRLTKGRDRLRATALQRHRSDENALDFSQQNLQWVASVYLLTSGGFLLLGGRLADLLGPRRVLVAGLLAFGACSLGGPVFTEF